MARLGLSPIGPSIAAIKVGDIFASSSFETTFAWIIFRVPGTLGNSRKCQVYGLQ
jgi:hypothetical protein